MADDASIVDQIDEGLKRLYELQKQDYPEEGFKFKCEENGIEDNETIEEEMRTPFEESQIADNDFLEGLCPWLKSEGDERVKEIWDILQECFKDPTAFSNMGDVIEPLRVSSECFDVNKEHHEKAIEIAQNQAPALYNTGFANDEVLLIMLAVSQKMKVNYLLFLVDMFLREAVHCQYSGKKNLVYGDWQRNNLHLQELCNTPIPNTSKNAGEIALAAITSYLHRVHPKLAMKAHSRIVGSLEDAANYIYQNVMFVAERSKEKGTCPFQYDAVYTFDKTVPSESKEDDSDDDDSEEEDDEDADEGNEECHESKIENIKDLLDKNKMQYVESTWKAKAEPRALRDGMNKLGRKLNDKNYPQFNRFISIVDLRDEAKDDEGSHKLYVFEPADGAKTIHRDPSALNFFHNSKSSIIPDPEADSDAEKKKQVLQACSNGPQFTLSFHVEREDRIRCYFYINGQYTRFMPKDLKMLLPLFFEATKVNQTYAEGKDILKLIQEMEHKLRDDEFRAFLKKAGVKEPRL